MSRCRALGALLLLLTLVIPIHDAHALAPPWNAAAATGTLVLPSGDLSLAPTAAPASRVYGSFTRFGLFDSQPQSVAPLRRVQVDYQAVVPADAQLRVDLRAAGPGSRWSDWTLNVAPGAIVTFDRVAREVQYRLTLLGNQQAPRVSRVEISPLALNDADLLRNALQDRVAPTYHIRATRMGLVGDRTANGHIITRNDWFVSLPSFRSLSSKGGSEYMARLSYGGKSIIVPVWEVGPWNIHDDYWNVNREKFADLPVGWPQDHAAYYDGYNGGWAEKGRVRFPTAADVGDGAWAALGIAFNDEQKALDITFLWQGSDPGPNPTPLKPGAKPAAPVPAAAPAAPAAPAGTITVDNRDAGFTRSAAKWFEWSCGQGKHALWTYSTSDQAKSTNTAAWRTKLATGTYEVSVFVPFCRNGKSDTQSALYTIQHATGSTSIKLNQAAQAGKWVVLGRFYFEGSGAVALTDLTGDKSRSVWFDAVKWTPTGP